MCRRDLFERPFHVHEKKRHFFVQKIHLLCSPEPPKETTKHRYKKKNSKQKPPKNIETRVVSLSPKVRHDAAKCKVGTKMPRCLMNLNSMFCFLDAGKSVVKSVFFVFVCCFFLVVFML